MKHSWDGGGNLELYMIILVILAPFSTQYRRIALSVGLCIFLCILESVSESSPCFVRLQLAGSFAEISDIVHANGVNHTTIP